MQNIRNFVIISHVDHGKSTLADRLLEITKTIPQGKMKPQYLDAMDLERERGITIKMQPVRMKYKGYILNLIDTPGHVDFSYEVSRSLAAVEGAVLLVDATKGIQAQTLANLELAKKQNLVIIPVINKIDLSQAQPDQTARDLANILGIDKAKVIKISAKLGTNVDKILELVIKNIPAPKINKEKPLRALIFDSAYNSYKGIIAYVRVMEGQVKNNEKIYLIAGKSNGQIKELGYFTPKLTESASLESGEIGYLATGIKEPGKIKVGDTITIPTVDNEIKLLPGYTEPQPVVFASFYPQDPDQYDALKEALAKLKLNDYALTFEPEMKVMLGRGFRCGFLGSLHAEIISERLSREFGLELIISQPSVVYKIIDIKKKEHLIYSSSDWMDFSQILEIKEPWAKLEVISPSSFLGNCLKVLESVEGHQIERKYISEERLILVYEIPLRELIVGFYDNLKGATQGYASMNYEILDYRKGDLVKLEILIAGQKEEAFSKIVPKDKAYEEGSKIVKKLKTAMPSQLFSVALQAVVQGKIIARETIRAKGKDVTASLYGGDYSRKRKLLEKQKKGKKELKVKGKIKIPPKTFLEMFKG
ncbi:MAG: elongation factor 4 [Parcubacteria group bacterium]|nr:elongation factor 4 [Parcubacteria group bacterium]|tara:strand:- start:40874 stop:42649 length:1776 start_codon:yes stop_codon:yes gene_type:complete